MTDELIDALGGIEGIEGYGKAGLAGEDGELEHTALWHVPVDMRCGKTGRSQSDCTIIHEGGATGCAIDIPLGHINAGYVRSHFDAMEVRLADAPRRGEIMFCLAMTKGPRIHHRMGGLGVGYQRRGWASLD